MVKHDLIIEGLSSPILDGSAQAMTWADAIELIGHLVTTEIQDLDKRGDDADAARLREAWEIVIRGV